MTLLSDLADTLRAVVAAATTGHPIEPILPDVKGVLERVNAATVGGGLTGEEKSRPQCAVSGCKMTFQLACPMHYWFMRWEGADKTARDAHKGCISRNATIERLEAQLTEERAKRETADRVIATLNEALVSACNRAKQTERDRDAAHIRNYEEQDEASALAASLQQRADKAEREIDRLTDVVNQLAIEESAAIAAGKKAERGLAEEREAFRMRGVFRDAALERAEKAEAHVVELKQCIESGRAAHNDERVARDFLAREKLALEARVAELEEQLRQYSALASDLVARTRRDR